jgi:hypothetical protein
VSNDDIVDSRLIHDERGLTSSSAADVRACFAYLLAELSRECGGRLPSLESSSGSAGRLRRKIELDKDRTPAELVVEEGPAGPDTARREVGGSGEDETYTASLPGDFRFPGLVSTFSSSVPRARPATARPRVPNAHN